MYGEVLGKAWRAVTRNPVLWIFGILAGCGGNAGGAGSSRGNFSGGTSAGNNSALDQFPGLKDAIKQAEAWLESIPLQVWIGLAIAVIAFILLGALFSALGKAGLVRAAYLFDSGQEDLGFGVVWSQGVSRMWQVILLNLAVMAVGLVVGGVIAVLVVATQGVGAICLIPLACLAIPIGWFVSVMVRLAVVAVAGEKVGVVTALQSAYLLTRENFVALLIFSVLLGLIELLGSLILVIPGMLIFPGLIARSIAISNYTPLMIMAGIFILIAIPIGGFITSYDETAWALTFRYLIQPKEKPKVVYPNPTGF